MESEKNCTMKKRITLLLLLSLLLSAAGCGSNGGSAAVSTDEKETDDLSTTSETVETDAPDNFTDHLRDADYEGYVFKICGEDLDDEYFVEEENGNVINDAIFQRNLEIEQRYNIALDFTLVEWTKGPEQIQQNVTAGDNVFDLYTSTHLLLGSVLTGGYLRDWNGVSEVDLTQPYYVQAANDTYSINGRTKLLFGDFMESNLTKAYVMLFNKRLTEDYAIDGLYEAVDNGTWTIDYFTGLIGDIYRDLNGDTVRDENDFYGFGTDNYAMVDSWSKALGFVAIDNSGEEPKLDFYKESTVDAYKKLYDLYFNTQGVYGTFDAFAAGTKMFIPGNCVFSNNQIGALLNDEMRAMEDDYGVLPYPKLDEAQEGYYTHLDGTYSAQMITVTVPDADIERTGTVVEALNAYSREYTIPAIYDVSLKMKASRDADSVRMLELALAGRRYSLDSLDENAFPLSPRCALRNNIQAGKENITSYYEANKDACEKWIEKMVEAFNASEE